MTICGSNAGSARRRSRASGRLKTSLAAAGVLCLLAAVRPSRMPAQSASFAGAQTTIAASAAGNDSPTFYATPITVDPNGNLYFVPQGTPNRVVKVAVDGTQTSPVSLPGGGARIAWAVAVDKTGNIFVTYEYNNAPTPVTEYPAGGGPPVPINVPSGGSLPYLTLDQTGNLFMSFPNLYSVTEWQAATSQLFTVPTSHFPNTSDQYGTPYITPGPLAVDRSGELYIFDQGTEQLFKETPSGNGPTAVLFSSDYALQSFAIDRLGNLLISALQYSSTADGYVWEKPFDVPTVNNKAGFPVGPLDLVSNGLPLQPPVPPSNIAVDDEGNLYVTDDQNQQIIKFQRVSVDFGRVNTCAPGSACGQTISLTYNVTESGSFGTNAVLTAGLPNGDFMLAEGSTCSGQLTAGSTCTVNVTFSPTLAGVRQGAVELVDANGVPIVTTRLFGIGVGAQVAFSPGVQTKPLVSYLTSVAGLAADGAGNVFVADPFGHQIVEVPASGGSQPLTGSTLVSPIGVVVDGAGNLFVADTGSNQVVQIPASGGAQSTIYSGPVSAIAMNGAGDLFIASTTQLIEFPALGGPPNTLATGLFNPLGLATDGDGNVYVADTGNLRLLKVTRAGTQTTVGGGLRLCPVGVAVDAANNLFVADECAQAVFEIPADGSGERTLASGLGLPSGIAVTAAGDLFVTVQNAQKLIEIKRSTAAPFDFASTIVDAASPTNPLSTTVENIGNEPLVVTGVSATPEFQSWPGSGTPVDCSTSPTLTPGGTCALAAAFYPNVGGTVEGSLVVSDNALNGNPGSQFVPLNGTALLVQQSITFNAIPAQPVGSSLPLNSSASSGLPVVFASTTPAVCTVSGSSAMLLAEGLCSILATQPGNYLYAAAAPVVQSFTVAGLAQSITFAAPAAQLTATTLNLTATASSGLPVTLSSLTSGICTISGTTATLLSPGVCVIQASQPGNNDYLAAAPVVQSFPVSLNPVLIPQSPSVNFGSVNVCTAGQGTPAPCNNSQSVSFQLTESDSIASIQVLTNGLPNLDFSLGSRSTCTGNLTAGATCSVNVTFAPAFAGLRQGAVQFVDAGGRVLAQTLLYGVGVGSQLVFGPGTQISLGSAWYAPGGIAVDPAGDLFVANNTNSVVKLPAGGGPASTVISGLNVPLALVIDGAGDLYVADSNNNRVVKLTTATGVATTVASGLNHPEGLAVDGAGDLFIADTFNQRVIELPAGGGAPLALGSNLSYPGAVAVDTAGNVFIADSFNRRVVKIAAGTGTQTTVGTELNEPESLAIDAAGDLFIGDVENHNVVEVPADGSPQITIGSGFSVPQGLVLDQTGNLYVSDTTNGGVFELQRSQAPSLSFAATRVGNVSAGSPQSVTIQNVGTLPLAATALAISPNFAQVTGTGTPADCSATSSLVPGAICNLSISFKPQATGEISGSAVLTDNALNGNPATQAIALAGTGLIQSQTLTFSGLPTTATYGAAGPYTLGATASSGLPASYSVTGPATLTGSSLTVTGAGTVMITASQAGNASYSAAPPVTITINIAPSASAIVLTAASITPRAGNPDLLTASVTGPGQQPGGTVLFLAGGKSLCSSSLGPSGVATCSYAPPASGAVTVSAQYLGDTNYLSSSSALILNVSPAYDPAIHLQLASTQMVYPGATNVTVCVTSATSAAATGTIKIYDGATLLTTQSLGRGGCAYWYISPGLGSGTHTVTSTYSGDKSNAPGTSAPVTVTVSPVPVTLSVSCWNSYFPYGGNYQCTTNVTSNAGSAAGSLTYTLDGGAAVTAPLKGGSAAFTIQKPAAGNHKLTLTFATQGNYAASPVQTAAFTVTPAPVGVALTPSAWYAKIGTNLTFQAAVTSWSAGPPSRNGAVSFYDGKTLLSTVNVDSNGQASFSTSALSGGSHTITAAYAGGMNYASTSTSANITIAP